MKDTEEETENCLLTWQLVNNDFKSSKICGKFVEVVELKMEIKFIREWKVRYNIFVIIFYGKKTLGKYPDIVKKEIWKSS